MTTDNPASGAASSAELKSSVAGFMSRADDILAHPLAASKAEFKLEVTFNTRTNRVVGMDFDQNNIAEADLFYLATKMRSIIFLSDDPIGLERLTGLIEREHSALRGQLKPLRVKFLEWKKRLLIGVINMGQASDPLPHGESKMTSMWAAPVGTPWPNNAHPDGAVGDFYYAELYFNSQVWHSDMEKAAQYQAASPMMKRHIAKCAELRTIGAIPFIKALRDWIQQARAAGEDF